MTTEINKISDQSMQYAEAAEKAFSQKTDMKNVDKANYKSILNQLSNYYKNKKQPEKAKVYEDKLAALG